MLPAAIRFPGLLVFIALLSSPLRAATGIAWDEPFTPDTRRVLKEASAVPTTDDGVVMPFRSIEFSFSADGRKIARERVVYRITSQNAVDEWSSVSVSWAPWYQERPEIRARVITPDGVSHVLDPKTIDDAPAIDDGPDIYSDSRLLEAPLPALTQGAVVEYETVTRDTAPFFPQGVVDAISFNQGVEVKETRLHIDYPKELQLSWLSRLPNAKEPLREEKDGRIRLTFVERDLKPLQHFQSGAPKDFQQFPYVAVTTGRSWQELATAYAAIVDRQIAAANVQPIVSKATKGAKSRESKIAALLASLTREVRYTGIEFGDASIVPRTPDEVLKRKYGDCKDKAAFLVALLRGAGIPANVAVLRAAVGWDVDPTLPGFGLFNHAIVYVPGEPAIWIDPTDEYARAGELPTIDQDRWALIADPATTGVVATPKAKSTANRISVAREFRLREFGPASITETITASGSIERDLRRSYTADAKELKENIEAYAKSHFVSDAVAKYDLSDVRDLSRPFELKLEIDKGERGETTLVDAAVGLFPANLLARLPWALRDGVGEEEVEEEGAEEPARSADFIFAEPYVEEWTYRVTPPPGFRVQMLPDPIDFALAGARMATTYVRNPDESVVATLRFDSGRDRITAAEFEEFRTKYRELAELPATLISWEQTGQALLDAGKVGESLTEFRRLSSRHPKEALHHSQIALALLAGGLGEKAREEARLAVQREPSSAIAHRTLGWILQHDLIGRRFYKGFDYAGSISAYESAGKLDPKDVIARADYAILLEHDKHGVRYSPEGRLKEAIAEYEAIRAELKDERLNDNLLYALMWLGDDERLHKVAKELDDSTLRDTMLLIAAARSESADAAIKLAPSLEQDKGQRRTIIGAAGANLMKLRLYPQAAALIAESAKGAPNASEVQSTVSFLREAKRIETMEFPADDPVTPLRKLFVAAAKPEVSIADFVPLFSDVVTDKLSSEGEKDLRELRAAVRGSTRGEEVDPRMLVEIALAAMRFSTEGSEALGYRVRPRAAAGRARSMDLTFLMRREGAEYRIAAGKQMWFGAGREVLKRLEKGDLAGARQWLDWAREDAVGPQEDEPFVEDPISRFWRKGDQGSPEQMRLAATALLLDGPPDSVKQAIDTFTAARATATPEQLVGIDLALARAYLEARDAEKLLPVGERLLAVRDDSDAAFRMVQQALLKLRRQDELRSRAEARLSVRPDDSTATRALFEIAKLRTDYESGARCVRSLVDRGEAGPGDLNDLAWLALFRQPLVESALEDAQQAVGMTEGKAGGVLHTLAAVYAERGQTTEARQMLLQSIEVSGDDEPQSEDWYVLGRIAEAYGEKDAAVAAYRKVTKPEDATMLPVSTYLLAEKRLKALK